MSVTVACTLAALAACICILPGMLWARRKIDHSARVTVISGGSSGIGLGLAKALVQRGARVVLIARSTDKLEAAVQELQPLLRGEASADFRAADLTSYEQVGAACAQNLSPFAAYTSAAPARPEAQRPCNAADTGAACRRRGLWTASAKLTAT